MGPTARNVRTIEAASRARTGVPGLDAMLHGGIPARSVTLLRGGPGAGKTTLALQFLAQGARDGEPGLLVTLEESVEDVLANAARHDLFTRDALDAGLVRVHALTLARSRDALLPSDRAAGATSGWLLSVGSTGTASGLSGDFGSETLATLVAKLVRESGAKRLVLDSLTMFTSQFDRKVDLNLQTLDLLRGLLRNDCTTLVTSHADPGGAHVISPEEYLAHGVVNLHLLHPDKEPQQAIQVVKMRGTSHDRELRPYVIETGGLVVDADGRV